MNEVFSVIEKADENEIEDFFDKNPDSKEIINEVSFNFF